MLRFPVSGLPLMLLLAACGGSSGGGNSARDYAMGFTPWPYDSTTAAVDFVYDEIANLGDIIAHHIDSGIPWQEALDGSAYPAGVEGELGRRLAGTPADMQVYLAISPLNSARDDVAGYWNDAGTQQALSPPWSSREFDSAEIIQAYTNFALDLIGRFSPDYFNLAIEASELAINDPVRFQKFVIFVEQVSSNIRAMHPDLPLMISVGLKSPGSASADIIEQQIPAIIQYIDVVGISTYPYVFYDHADKGDPANLPGNWLSQISAIASGKPIAVAETGWIAERLLIPTFSVDVAADASDQEAYMIELLQQVQELEARFVIWFFLVDFDALWNGVLGQDPIARIWRDTGLYDEGLNPRPAMTVWRDRLDD